MLYIIRATTFSLHHRLHLDVTVSWEDLGLSVAGMLFSAEEALSFAGRVMGRLNQFTPSGLKREMELNVPCVSLDIMGTGAGPLSDD